MGFAVWVTLWCYGLGCCFWISCFLVVCLLDGRVVLYLGFCSLVSLRGSGLLFVIVYWICFVLVWVLYNLSGFYVSLVRAGFWL